MSVAATIHLQIDRVIIDEVVHRSGPDVVRAALESQLPALLAANGVRQFPPAAAAAATGIAAQISTSSSPRKP